MPMQSDCCCVFERFPKQGGVILELMCKAFVWRFGIGIFFFRVMWHG